MSTPRLDALISEKAWASQVVSLLHLHGWKTYRTWLSIHSDPGFPDILAAHPRLGLWAIELKAEKGTLTDAQASWLNALEMAGVRCFVLRPRDWPLAERIARGEA